MLGETLKFCLTLYYGIQSLTKIPTSVFNTVMANSRCLNIRHVPRLVSSCWNACQSGSL